MAFLALCQLGSIFARLVGAQSVGLALGLHMQSSALQVEVPGEQLRLLRAIVLKIASGW